MTHTWPSQGRLAESERDSNEDNRRFWARRAGALRGDLGWSPSCARKGRRRVYPWERRGRRRTA